VNPYFHSEFKGLITTGVHKDQLDSKYPYARNIHRLSKLTRKYIKKSKEKLYNKFIVLSKSKLPKE
jgi:hypothetical protein